MLILSSNSRLREAQFCRGEDSAIVIGLVNNMPDTALRTTERQFCELISAAGHDLSVHLRLFCISQVSQGSAGRSPIKSSYDDISELWTSRLDGLIVTGTEPRAPALADEPYWSTLAKLINWAEEHTVSTIWSCLAAHAAVLHLDGIHRRKLRQKLSGIFECSKAEEHTIMLRAPSSWCVPHSRWNELPEQELVLKGYTILSKSPEAGIDIFVRQRKSLFIFAQGHPEYDPGALFREYRRDSGRFLSGERDSYPDMPRRYFDDKTIAVLAAYRERALSDRSPDLASSFPDVSKEGLSYSWRRLAIQLYTNWLSYLAKERAQSLRPTRSPVFRDALWGSRQPG
jgi:homoserine O-succinyltransferase